jgi:hypothetical protein
MEEISISRTHLYNLHVFSKFFAENVVVSGSPFNVNDPALYDKAKIGLMAVLNPQTGRREFDYLHLEYKGKGGKYRVIDGMGQGPLNRGDIVTLNKGFVYRGDRLIGVLERDTVMFSGRPKIPPEFAEKARVVEIPANVIDPIRRSGLLHAYDGEDTGLLGLLGGLNYQQHIAAVREAAERGAAPAEILAIDGGPAVSRKGEDDFAAQEARWGARLADVIRLAADKARREGEKARQEKDNIIIAIETNNWIPELQKRMNLIQPWLNEFVDRLNRELRQAGLDNVKIVTGAGGALAGAIEAVQAAHNVKNENVVVLASKETLTSSVFDALRGKVFLAALDTTAIMKDETADGLNYVRLFEALLIAVRLGFKQDGLETLKSAHPDLIIDDKTLVSQGIILIIQKADPIARKRPEELKETYRRQAEALLAV